MSGCSDEQTDTVSSENTTAVSTEDLIATDNPTLESMIADFTERSLVTDFTVVTEPPAEVQNPVLAPANYTVQPKDGLYGIGSRLTAAHPELLSLAGNYLFADYLYTCIRDTRPNPNVIHAGDVIPLNCGVTPDQIIPISSYVPPAPPAPPAPVATPQIETAAATEASPAPAEEAVSEPVPASAPAPAAAPQGSFKDYAMSQVGDAEQFDCLESLWGKESGWNPNAQNPSSTAYGIAQFLDATWAGTGIAKTSDGYRQIDAGLIYIKNRFGSPCGAWSHSQSKGWY
jgi:hypothetical protein